MKKMDFQIDINAPRERVWEVLWTDSTYREWTSVFSPGSHAVSDWNQGSRIHFLSAEKDGMFSEIREKKPNEYMSFKHLGEIKGGQELPPTSKTESWAGSTENYTLNEKSGGTELVVDMDITAEFEDYFKTAFPKALQKIKELAENGK